MSSTEPENKVVEVRVDQKILEDENENENDDCSSTSSSSSSETNVNFKIPDDPDHQFGVDVREMAVDDDASKDKATKTDLVDDGREERARPTNIAANNSNRVRFRVEPTTLDNAVTPTTGKPPLAPLSSAVVSNNRSVLRRNRIADESALDSTESLSTGASGDSMDSLYNLSQILPAYGAVGNDRAFDRASFIDSIPPYVTVRLPSDVPSPALPLSWYRNHGDNSKTAAFVNFGQSTQANSTSGATPNFRNLNKSASYTAANTVVAPTAIVSQAYRNYFTPSPSSSSPSNRGLNRKYSAGRAGRQQAVQWPTSTPSTNQVISSTNDGTTSAPPIFSSLKYVQTEHVMSKHALKAKLNKYQRILDNAFAAIIQANGGDDVERKGSAEAILQSNSSIVADALTVVAKVFSDAWALPSLGLDLAYGLCDYVREVSYFDTIIDLYMNNESVREEAGLALEGCFSCPNRDYLVNGRGLLEPLVLTAKTVTSESATRVSLRLLEGLFKQNAQTNSRLISLSAVDFVLNACKATTDETTYRHAAFALSNLSMYSDHECQQKMLEKNVPDWLFLLASSQDDVTRYYACLAICTLVSNKEIETAVTKSGTLSLVEPFLSTQKPCDFAMKDLRHRQGRRREWLEKLVPMLSAKRREPRAMAAFHFAMEAIIKKKQEKLDGLRDFGAVEALKQAAALPDEMASKLASLALEIIGEQLPQKLSPQVPLWTVEDVQYWVTQIGFELYAAMFAEQKVDGDLLLLLTSEELDQDIGMTSGLYRKRFMRELDSLKMAADYGCIDESRLDRFLASVDPHFSVYTYRLLEMGVDCAVLPSLCDTVLKDDCGIANPVHRLKLLASLEECKHVDDMEVALLSKRIDIFISYRRSTGNQLASLLKVMLQLRAHKVFIDVDRLYAGQFDSSLLKNIQAAKHFVLVLTPNALDRCIGDDMCNDWVHKEVRCALEHNKNVIPVLDPRFEWPDETQLPADMKAVTRFNAVRWVHEYQEACVTKLEKFIKGELNVNRGFYPSLPQRNKFFPAYNRSTSKPNSSSNGTTNSSATDLVLDALAPNNRSSAGCRSSSERLLAPGSETSQQQQIHDVVWDYN